MLFMKMCKDLFVKIEVRLKEEKEVFFIYYFIIALFLVMLLEIESWNKWWGLKFFRVLRENG